MVSYNNRLPAPVGIESGVATLRATYLIAALQGQRSGTATARLQFQRSCLMHQLDFTLRNLYIVRWRHYIMHILLVIIVAILLVLPAKFN